MSQPRTCVCSHIIACVRSINYNFSQSNPNNKWVYRWTFSSGGRHWVVYTLSRIQQEHTHESSTGAERDTCLSMKVPKSSLMVFCMFSVQSQLHWSFISRHTMFKATSATAVSAVHSNRHTIHSQQHNSRNMFKHTCMTHMYRQNASKVESDCEKYSANEETETMEFYCGQAVMLSYCMQILQDCKACNTRQEWYNKIYTVGTESKVNFISD